MLLMALNWDIELFALSKYMQYSSVRLSTTQNQILNQKQCSEELYSQERPLRLEDVVECPQAFVSLIQDTPTKYTTKSSLLTLTSIALVALIALLYLAGCPKPAQQVFHQDANFYPLWNTPYFSSWTPAKANVRIEFSRRVERLPYSSLVLLQGRDASSPSYHYPEVVAWLSTTSFGESVYVSHASPYLVLLLAASTSPSVKLTVAPSLQTEYIGANLRTNRLEGKWRAAKEGMESLEMDKSDLVVAVDPEESLWGLDKKVLAVVGSRRKRPQGVKAMSRIELNRLDSQGGGDGPITVRRFEGEQLERGVYLINM